MMNVLCVTIASSILTSALVRTESRACKDNTLCQSGENARKVVRGEDTWPVQEEKTKTAFAEIDSSGRTSVETAKSPTARHEKALSSLGPAQDSTHHVHFAPAFSEHVADDVDANPPAEATEDFTHVADDVVANSPAEDVTHVTDDVDANHLETPHAEATEDVGNELLGDALEPVKRKQSGEGGGEGQQGVGEAHSAETAHSTQQHGYVALLFLFGALSLGGLLLIVLERFVPALPYTCGLFIVGMLSSIINNVTPHDSILYWTTWFHSTDMWEKINPHLLFFVFLPPLLFSEAMRINVKLAKTCLPQVLLLACPGVIFGTVVTGLVAKFILPYEWDWPMSLVFGAIMSATDPVAVVALFNTLGVSPRLTMVISGESLLNDGTAIVLFTLFLKVLLGAALTFEVVVVFLFRMVLLSVLVGIGVALVAIAVIDYCSQRYSHHDAMIQVVATICCAYLAFFVSEVEASGSGVLATVSAGTVLAYYAWPRFACRETINIVWEAIEFVGNTVIFFLAGMLFMNVVVERSTFIQFVDVFWLLLIYVLLLFIRAAMVAFLWKPLNMVGTPLDPKEGVVMVWSGLRGAVSLTMAIIVDIEPQVSKQMGSRVMFHVGGIAALTCLINATTAAPLLEKLGLSKASSMKLRMVSQFKSKLTAHVMHTFEQMLDSNDVRFSGADCAVTASMVPVLRETDVARKAQGEDPLEQFKKEPVVLVVGDRMTICKPGNYLGHTCSILDPSWNGLVKVKMDADGSTKSYSQAHLSLESRAAALPTKPAHATIEEDTNALAQAYREVFLRVVQSRYWGAIDEGVIPRNHDAARILLHSTDEAMDTTMDALSDWPAIEREVNCKGVQIVFVVLCFLDAHIHAMREIPKYFGSNDGDIDQYVQDTIAQESRQQCQRAVAVVEGLDKKLVELGRSEMLARRLVCFQLAEVDEMKEKGYLSAKEAGDYEHELHHALRNITECSAAGYANRAPRHKEGTISHGH
jgi:NhaP-type Na+/H+ or K+/H+ antiporter